MSARLKDDSTVNKNDETEDLLVFGYSCKLFRDDEKALFIDQGKHLIPWMGDESLKIDRYDGRGTLFDLKSTEAPSGGYDRFFGLTDLERQVEVMCDEERYRALVTNEEEESMYQEEELKRLHYAINEKGNSYGQVEYKYEGNSNNEVQPPPEKVALKVEDTGDDEPFVPAPQLDIPLNMVLPETVKHNAIIEKTAMFISSQGPQMEILLKMKQAGNPQFKFLSFDDPLHSYYRHLLMAIKGGRFKPQLQDAESKKDQEIDEDEHYLHPSLASSVSKVELAPSIPSISYKPSAHCAYSMLVNKIKDKKTNTAEPVPPHLSKLRQALERFKGGKKSEDEGSAESDSNYSTGSKCSTRSISSVVSNHSAQNNQTSAVKFQTPPHDMQVIIDKMASYVAKNGRDFETIVQSKEDARFDFLNPAHVYHAYYQYKVTQYENLEKPAYTEEKNKITDQNAKIKDDQAKGKLAPVCFSIKKPKESETVIEKSALPVEESSDEEAKEEKETQQSEEKVKEVKEEIVTVDLAAQEEKEEKNKKILAAERIKDKLTAAVREKVALASKEKQLQLERKRRAAAFLKTLQPDSADMKSLPLYGPQLPGGEMVERICDDDSDVTSLPDVSDETNEFKTDGKNNVSCDVKEKQSKNLDRKHEKRHRTLSSNMRHKHREKHRLKIERHEKIISEETRSKEVNDRISDPYSSSDENDSRRVYYTDDFRKLEKRKIKEEGLWKNKCDKIRSLRQEEGKHKRKKHKKDDERDKNLRKHTKSKKQRRSRSSDDERSSRSKRHRRDSVSSSGDPGS